MSAKFVVKPVRKVDGRGWILTDPHRAQAWALCHFRRGAPLRQLLRFPRKADAEKALPSVERAAAGPSRAYKLGARMPKRKEK